jgi:hypothetical protein
MKCTLAKLFVCTNPKCAKEYYVSQGVLKEGHGRYCSKECRSEHLQTKLKVKCLNPRCNKILKVTRYNLEHGIKKYCSKDCKLSRKTGQILKCRKCGKDFYVNPSQADVRKNCSMKCYKTGDLTPLHKKIRHLPIYFDWRLAVFERDNYACRDCGIKRDLEVHHIKDFKAIKSQYSIQTIEDAVKCDELWDVNNGITLCRKDHLETENHGARKRKKNVDLTKDSILMPVEKAVTREIDSIDTRVAQHQ